MASTTTIKTSEGVKVYGIALLCQDTVWTLEKWTIWFDVGWPPLIIPPSFAMGYLHPRLLYDDSRIPFRS